MTTIASAIPSDWMPFVSVGFNRVFINPASGCRGNCAYCYIFDYGHPHKPKIFLVSGREVRGWLESQPGFRRGRNGTLLSFGSSCDPFDPNVTAKTLEIVGALAPMGNPIQLSTKYLIGKATTVALSEAQVANGQIVVMATITSFRHWEALEPGTDEPHARLLGLLNAKEQGLATCLYIKPVLPGITETELPSFVEAIHDYEIPYCTTGIIYASTGIHKKLKSRAIPVDAFPFETETGGRRPPPSKQNESAHSFASVEPVETIACVRPVLEGAGAECTISAPCVVALAYGVLCPTGIWIGLPELCVDCRADCRNMLIAAGAAMNTLFLQTPRGVV